LVFISPGNKQLRRAFHRLSLTTTMPSSSKRSYESGSDEEVYQPVKRSKAVAATDATMDASTILKLSKTKLEKMDHTELVNAIIVLQQQAKQSGGVTTLSDKQIEEKAELARKAMVASTFVDSKSLGLTRPQHTERHQGHDDLEAQREKWWR
jgi:hypothetical protein